jgi:hypothetical protein
MDDDNGLMYYVLNWFVVRMPFIIIYFLILFTFVYAQLSLTDNTFDVETEIYTTRLLSSPNSFTYLDPYTQRAYPGIIDIKQFDDAIINEVIDTSKNQIAGKLTLAYDNQSNDIFLNKKYYERWQPYLGFKKYNQYVKWFYVLVEENNKQTPATLRIELVRPNE